jgi:hypothetical protein
MNMLKKGPELKLSDLKVPNFIADVYYDLRERHLLPLVAILLVALVALPIALGGGSGGTESENSEGATADISSVAVPSSNLVVAKSSPGLREYRRRFRDRAPQDPFEERYASQDAGGGVGSAGSATASSSGSSGTEEPPQPESNPVEPPQSEPADVETPEDNELPPGGDLTYYSFVIDVRVTPGSGKGEGKKPEPTVRRDQPALTMLPSRKTPALTFMTVSKDEKKVLMLVNDNVRGVFGDGVCVVGTDSCQLLALEPGIPVTVVYGADERTYRIEVIELHAVKTESLNKAPLGKTKKRQDEPEQSG